MLCPESSAFDRSCTECHRRKQLCDRNIPCHRCIKRGVPELCRMENPAIPPRKGKRKREDSILPMENNPNAELIARIAALENIFRNPQMAQGLGLDGTGNFAGMTQAASAMDTSRTGAVDVGNQAHSGGDHDMHDNQDQADIDGDANISAGLAALLQATAQHEQGTLQEQDEQHVVVQPPLAPIVDDSGASGAEAASLLAQIAQSLQKVQPIAQPEPEPPTQAQGGLLMDVLSHVSSSTVRLGLVQRKLIEVLSYSSLLETLERGNLRLSLMDCLLRSRNLAVLLVCGQKSLLFCLKREYALCCVLGLLTDKLLTFIAVYKSTSHFVRTLARESSTWV